MTGERGEKDYEENTGIKRGCERWKRKFKGWTLGLPEVRTISGEIRLKRDTFSGYMIRMHMERREEPSGLLNSECSGLKWRSTWSGKRTGKISAHQSKVSELNDREW